VQSGECLNAAPEIVEKRQNDVMLEGLFNPNPMKKKWLLILDTDPEHVDSENIKFKIGCRSSLSPLPTFSKT
jgi:hypothetical protein